MCTVSFVASNDKVIITSNRDEQVLRPAIAPKSYVINQKKVIFPKDPKAGGTWFAVAENANVLVLLNGASEKHHWNPPYRKSRGLIILDLISAASPLLGWKTIALENIEPFTIVLYEARQLYQLRWSGMEKETVRLDENRNYIWSSATLYPKEIRRQRSEWFYHFLETNPDANETQMFHFHRYTEDNNHENGLVINRNDILKTLSITQTVIERMAVKLIHYDLADQSQTSDSFLINLLP